MDQSASPRLARNPGRYLPRDAKNTRCGAHTLTVSLAVIAPPFPGHFNPLQALAAELVGRGHRVTFFQQPDAAPLLRDARLGFTAVGARTHPPGHLGSVMRRIGALRGLWGAGALLRDLAASTDMLCAELPAALTAAGIDAIIGDGTEAAGGLVARRLGLPLITLACALPINTEPALPPPFVGWPYDPSPAGIRRNRGGARIARLVSWRMRRVIAARARAWNLGDLRDIEDTLSPDLQISQMVAPLDFPRTTTPALHYVGPLRPTTPVPNDAMPADLPPRYAYVTLGTLQGARADVFAAAATACAAADLPCVITHGGRLSAAQTARLPGSPLCFDTLPQPAIMRRAALVITHGGLNTVLDALTCGVPLAIIPLAFEQAAIAARVRHAGAGLRASLAHLPAHIRHALTCRPAAERLAAHIARAGGVRAAADLIEARLSVPMC